MKTREEYIALIASHAEELQNTFGITSLRLFGSVARNEHHKGSDVDGYVEMPPKFFLVVRLKAYLEEFLDCPVDIIRKHQHLNPILLKEIEKDGIEVIVPYKNKVTIYDNTPILVAKSFTNFNFADFILVNQRITIP